jgi:hypothetical protein
MQQKIAKGNRKLQSKSFARGIVCKKKSFATKSFASKSFAGKTICKKNHLQENHLQ